MQIFVDLPHGSGKGTLCLHVHPARTLSFLKSLLVPPTGSMNLVYFSFAGRALEDGFRFVDYGIPDCSTLDLRVRAHGGGGDGGATGAESRDCYLNMYATKKPDKIDPNEVTLAKWSRCALSSEALKPPCVVDFLGNLFNKEALVSALLLRNLPKELRHIRGLKDMVPIRLSSIPGVSPDDENSITKFHCPISGQEFNGKFKFFVLRGCGHVISARALKEVQTCTCLVCHAPYCETDKIVINGTEEEVLALKKRMEEGGPTVRDKKKKTKNHEDTKQDRDSYVEEKTEGGRHLENDIVSSIKRKSETNGLLDKQGNATKQLNNSEAFKKFKAADQLPPNATKDVYASIFTSSNKSDFKETFTCRSLPIGRN